MMFQMIANDTKCLLNSRKPTKIVVVKMLSFAEVTGEMQRFVGEIVGRPLTEDALKVSITLQPWLQ